MAASMSARRRAGAATAEDWERGMKWAAEWPPHALRQTGAVTGAGQGRVQEPRLLLRATPAGRVHNRDEKNTVFLSVSRRDK